jgi:hypothetical protein
MKNKKFSHEFVELIPMEINENTLYVSIAYGTVTHKCACGCGNEVVTPLNKKGWSMTYDGESISLYPSIGNWNLPCKSHYWVRENKIKWSIPWKEYTNQQTSERNLWQRFLSHLN